VLVLTLFWEKAISDFETANLALIFSMHRLAISELGNWNFKL